MNEFTQLNIALLLLSFVFVGIYNNNMLIRHFVKGINLLQIIVLVAIPLSCGAVVSRMVFLLLQNAEVPIAGYSDTIFYVANLILISLTFMGLGMHFTAKSLSYYLPRKGKIRSINKIFHIHLSHILVFTAVLLGVANLSMLAKVHPFTYTFSGFELVVLVFAGLTLGILMAMAIARANHFTLYYILLSSTIGIVDANIARSGSPVALTVSSFFFSLSFMQVIIAALAKKNIFLVRFHDGHVKY